MITRRRLLKTSLTGAAKLAVVSGIGGGIVGGVGIVSVRQIAQSRSHDLAALVAKIGAMPVAQLSNAGEWSVGQVFAHMAQSIDYSMTGYPQMKSELFRATGGNVAFHLFGAAGQMRHPLNEAIPGAPELPAEISNEDGFALLQQSARNFLAFRQQPRPLFAFGDLSMAQYEAAHCLHILNHLQAFSAA